MPSEATPTTCPCGSANRPKVTPGALTGGRRAEAHRLVQCGLDIRDAGEDGHQRLAALKRADAARDRAGRDAAVNVGVAGETTRRVHPAEQLPVEGARRIGILRADLEVDDRVALTWLLPLLPE